MSDRYQRHGLIDWFDQERVKGLSALVIGAGAVGNEVIKNLVLLGVGFIRIVDFDRIEVHNLTRTVLFTEGDIGHFKAEVAAAAAQRLNSECKVEAVCGDFWERLTFAQIREANVVFCCVDNLEARFRINRLCCLLQVDLINAGIDSRAVSAESYLFGRNPASACLECNIPPSAYQRARERYSCGWLRRIAFQEKKVPTTAITASHAGALATSLLLYSYRGSADLEASKVFMDTISHTTSRSVLPKQELCAGCGRNGARRVVLRARRNLAREAAWLPRESDEITLTLSDAVLTAWEMPNCPRCTAADRVPVFEKASLHDESGTHCDKCGENLRQPVIRDQFTTAELLAEFPGRPLPGKYVSFKTGDLQVVVELED